MLIRVRSFLFRYFKLSELNTDIRTEFLGGLTTFFTMAYIIVVNPAVLEACGIPRGASITATCLSAFIGTFLMGIYAKRPFAIAPYMGENAFVAYTVCGLLGYSWQTALGAVFIGGVLFVLLTVLRLRPWFARCIPNSLKYAFTSGLGLFLCFIGLKQMGLVEVGLKGGSPLRPGDFHSPQVLLGILTLILMGFLLSRKIKGAFLIGMTLCTLLAGLLGFIRFPARIIETPHSISETFMKLDVVSALRWGFFSVILSLFIMDFVDTLGTLIGVASRAKMLDRDGNLPEIEKPMLCDAVSTCAGAILGTTTTGAYIESASGIEEGARSGLSSVVVAALFFLSLFLWPFFTVIPPYAYGPVLVLVGVFMLESMKRIDFSQPTEFLPAILVVILISFTYNMGIGITAGFIVYPLMKIISGRFKELNWGLIGLGALSLLFYVFYPWH